MISRKLAEEKIEQVTSNNIDAIERWKDTIDKILGELLELRGQAEMCGRDHTFHSFLRLTRKKVDRMFATVSVASVQINHLLDFTNFSKEDFVESLMDAEPYEVHSVKDITTRIEVWKMTDGHCAYCGCEVDDPDIGYEIDSPEERMPMHIEHVVPASRGGPDNLSNYVPSCQKCNSTKSDGHVLEFIRRVQGKEKSISQPVQLVSDNARQQA